MNNDTGTTGAIKINLSESNSVVTTPDTVESFFKNIRQYLPNNYHFINDMIFHVVSIPEKDKDGEENWKEIRTKICSPLAITALTHDDSKNQGGLLIQWVDIYNRLRQGVFPRHLIIDDFKKIGTILSKNIMPYLPMTSKARLLFMDMLQLSTPEKSILYTEKTGWNDGSFVFPDYTIGDKEIVFQSTSPHHKPPKITGTLEDWQNKIGKYCEGNPVLVLGACAAFAAPLNGLLGGNGFTIHLIGQSSTGKTLSVGTQSSIFGQPKGSWRATDNGKESEFEAKNHIGASLDELGQSNPKDAHHMAYMLGNGQGKLRANQDGTQKEVKTFNLIAFSTGELSLDDMLAMAGKSLTGGMSVRFIQGISDVFKYGCFDNIHKFNTGAEFATYLETVTGISGDNYTPEASGVIGIEFIKYLAENIGSDTIKLAKIKDQITKVANSLIEDNFDSQLERMAKSIATLIVSGQLATQAGLTGWNPKTSAKEIKRWWKECVLQTRVGTGSTENEKAIEHVRDFFQLHHMSHFTEVVEGFKPQHNVGKHFGYVIRDGKDRKGNVLRYAVTTAGFKEICKGYSPKTVAKLLNKQNLLITDVKRLQKSESIYSIQSKYYSISVEILS